MISSGVALDHEGGEALTVQLFTMEHGDDLGDDLEQRVILSERGVEMLVQVVEEPVGGDLDPVVATGLVGPEQAEVDRVETCVAQR